jgi:hypothetical protein
MLRYGERMVGGGGRNRPSELFEAAALLVQNNSPLSNEIVGSNQAPQPEVIFLPAT